MKATSWESSSRGPGAGGGDDPYLYPEGECTWFASSRRPDIPFFPGIAGDATNWARSAERAGFRVSGAPQVGDVVVFHAGQAGAGLYGHVAIVQRIEGDRIRIEEANYRGTPPGSTRTVRWRGENFRFIHGRAIPLDQPSRPPEVPPNLFRYYVYRACAYRTTCRIVLRKLPGLTYDEAGTLPEGAIADVACQTIGDRVIGRDATSTNVWDRLWDGRYISDYWVSTRGKADAFTSPIPRCEDLAREPSPSPPNAPPPEDGSPPPPESAPVPEVQLTAPASGVTVTGAVQLSATSNASAVQFAAYYAAKPSVLGSATWHVIGTDASPADGFGIDWNSATIPSQGLPRENTVRISATALTTSGEPTGVQDIRRISVANPTADGTYIYRVYGTCTAGTCELNLRTGPGFSSYPKVGAKQEGDEVRVVCQARGETVSDGTSASSDIWDKFSDGKWGSDFYIDTPRAGEFSPPIPEC